MFDDFHNLPENQPFLASQKSRSQSRRSKVSFQNAANRHLMPKKLVVVGYLTILTLTLIGTCRTTDAGDALLSSNGNERKC